MFFEGRHTHLPLLVTYQTFSEFDLVPATAYENDDLQQITEVNNQLTEINRQTRIANELIATTPQDADAISRQLTLVLRHNAALKQKLMGSEQDTGTDEMSEAEKKHLECCGFTPNE